MSPKLILGALGGIAALSAAYYSLAEIGAQEEPQPAKGKAGVKMAIQARKATPTPQPGWQDRVVSTVSAHEGSYGSMNLNRDNAGLSFGMIQWSQKPGSLGRLLAAMNEADPLAFRRIFGEHSTDLLAFTLPAGNQAKKLHGAYLYEPPWTDRFAVASRNEIFRKVQRLEAVRGYMPGAEKGAKAAGHKTERMMALLYDRSVQQGPSAAARLGRDAAGLPYQSALNKIAEMAAGRFRKTGPNSPGSGWRKMADGSWHKWRGSFDLYEGIKKRSANIIGNKALSDVPIA